MVFSGRRNFPYPLESFFDEFENRLDPQEVKDFKGIDRQKYNVGDTIKIQWDLIYAGQ
jgi:hypothetical protein